MVPSTGRPLVLPTKAVRIFSCGPIPPGPCGPAELVHANIGCLSCLSRTSLALSCGFRPPIRRDAVRCGASDKCVPKQSSRNDVIERLRPISAERRGVDRRGWRQRLRCFLADRFRRGLKGLLKCPIWRSGAASSIVMIAREVYLCANAPSVLNRSTRPRRQEAWAPSSSLLEAISSLPAAACSVIRATF
jgi:hypothetical protein